MTISNMCPASGEMLKRDGKSVNIADKIETIEAKMLLLSNSYPVGATPWALSRDSDVNSAKTITRDAEAKKNNIILRQLRLVRT